MLRRIFAIIGLLMLTGCPYTEGCEALGGPIGEAPKTEPTAPAERNTGLVGDNDGKADGGPSDLKASGQAAPIDFGQEPSGGPALSTLACPELAMPLPAVQSRAIVYVEASSAAAEDGSKAAPFRTIGKAFANAAPMGVVFVAAGTYKENLTVPDKDLAIFGGFASGFGSRTDACATIVEAENGAQPVFSASASVKSFTLEGLSIQKGSRGLVVAGDESIQARFTIARSVFSENGVTTEVGGATAFDSVNVRVFRSVFHDNRASKGAALASGGKVTLTVDQNVFTKNLGYSDHGGGLYLSATKAKISRNTFRGNATGVGINGGLGGGWGGAVIVYNNSALIPAKADFAFNVFTENLAGIGGAVFVDEGATITMSHDLLYRNRAYPENGFLRGAALYADGTGVDAKGGSTLIADYLTVVNNVYDDTGKLAEAPTAFGGNAYVEGFSKATFTNSIFWNNGDNAFYAEAENEIAIKDSVGPNGCTTSSNAQGFVPAGETICKIGTGVIQPQTVDFVDESKDDYRSTMNLGAFAQ